MAEYSADKPKFVSTLIETICLKTWAEPLPQMQKVHFWSKKSLLQLSIISRTLKGLKGKDFKEPYLLYSSPVNPKKVTAEITANFTL